MAPLGDRCMRVGPLRRARRRPHARPRRAAAAALPPLLVAAERVAATVAQGVHGRRRVGQGETFWQFRHYQPGDAASRIDWRESAKSQRLYVRETEWEAAQSVWLWRDASPSMDYASASRRLPTKRERAELILRWRSPRLLVRGGERVTLLGSGPAGSTRPRGARAAWRLLAAPRAPHGRRACRPSSRCRAHGAARADRRFPVAARRDVNALVAGFAARRAQGPSAAECSIRPRRRCPSPAACASKGSRARSRSADQPRRDACATPMPTGLPRHREGLAAIARARRLELRHASHRPAAADRRCWRSTPRSRRSGRRCA